MYTKEADEIYLKLCSERDKDPYDMDNISRNFLFDCINEALNQVNKGGVSKCLPTEKEYLEIRNELAKEHIDRLSKQPLYFILRAGIEKGMDVIINRVKANDC